MRVKCPTCGFEDEGDFCSNCGAPLLQIPLKSNQPRNVKNPWAAKCPVCRRGSLRSMVKQKLLGGLTMTRVLRCYQCGAVFTPDRNKYVLSDVGNKSARVWREYGMKSLTGEEWKRIASGGVSNARQRAIDIRNILLDIKKGNTELEKFIGVHSSLILKRDEELKVVLPNIGLWEPHSVRHGIDGYGGRSTRVDKGGSWLTRVFGGRRTSHEKTGVIDNGVLTLTNERLVFIGSKLTTEIGLAKIISVRPFADGIAVNRSGTANVQHFVGLKSKNITITLVVNGRRHRRQLDGMSLAYIIEGIVTRQS